MNKSVPTLLGVAVILLVVILAVLFYNIKLTRELGEGATVVGTIGGEQLTGVEQPKVAISPNEAIARQTGKHEVASATQLEQKRVQKGKGERQQERRQQRLKTGQKTAEKPTK